MLPRGLIQLKQAPRSINNFKVERWVTDNFKNCGRNGRMSLKALFLRTINGWCSILWCFSCPPKTSLYRNSTTLSTFHILSSWDFSTIYLPIYLFPGIGPVWRYTTLSSVMQRLWMRCRKARGQGLLKPLETIDTSLSMKKWKPQSALELIILCNFLSIGPTIVQTLLVDLS